MTNKSWDIAGPALLVALVAMRDDWLTAFDNDVQAGNPDAVKILADADAAIAQAGGEIDQGEGGA